MIRAEDDEAHVRIGRMVAGLPKLEAPANWQERVLAEVDVATPTPRWRTRPRHVAVLVALAAAAGMLVWLLTPTPIPPAQVAFALELRRDGTVRRGTEGAALGDTLTIRAPLRDGGGLWLYRDQERVLECPGPACRLESAELRAEFILRVPGTYRAILIASPPATSSGVLADDLALLQRLHVRVESAPPIEVR